MRKLALALLLFALGTGCRPKADFDGRWDISYPEFPIRASWLEVQGSNTSSPKVRFISAYRGDLNVADEVSIRGDEITFGFRFESSPKADEKPVPRHTVCKARLVGGQLTGSTQTEGSGQSPAGWVGVRAPEIPDRDDGTWREENPIALLNGKDLTGWKALEPDLPFDWKVENGVLKAPGGGANLVSERTFWNFRLHIEFRVAPHSNSGIGLRGRYEVQILEDHGQPPDTHSNGSLYSRIAPSVNASKPANEWQTYDVTLIGRDLTVVLNGVKIIDRQVAEGLTAMAHDSHEGMPGPISLQGDHGPVEFRNVVLTPLAK